MDESFTSNVEEVLDYFNYEVTISQVVSAFEDDLTDKNLAIQKILVNSFDFNFIFIQIKQIISIYRYFFKLIYFFLSF